MKVTKTNVRDAITNMSGNLSAVARLFERSRQWLYTYLEKHPDLWDTVKEARETMLDNVESRLYQKALAGDTTSMIFFLKTQGKSRGYTERHEHSGKDGEPLKIIFSWDDGGEND